jgi:chromosome segregation ATPase
MKRRLWMCAWVTVAGCLVGLSHAQITNTVPSSAQPTAVSPADDEMEKAIQDVQMAEQAVRQAMHDVEYTDPECAKLKADLVELERKVLSLRQQLYAAIRASDVVRQAESRRQQAAQRLQELRRRQGQNAEAAPASVKDD